MPFQIEQIPEISAKDWKLKITGLVKKPIELKLGELEKLPCEELQAAIICLQGKKISGSWLGVNVKTLAEKVKVLPSARYVIIKAVSSYAEPLKLEDALSQKVILAYRFGYEPVAPEHGGPLRLIAPDKYAYKSVKWVNEIEFLSDYKPGYWERKGYPQDDQIKVSGQ